MIPLRDDLVGAAVLLSACSSFSGMSASSVNPVNWITPYKQIVDAARTGKPHPNFMRGGLKEGYVKTSPYGAMVPEGARSRSLMDKALGSASDTQGKTIAMLATSVITMAAASTTLRARTSPCGVCTRAG